MNQDDAAEFSRAVNLARTGNKVAAHAIFITLISKYPDNSSALLWFAFTAPTLDEAGRAISKAAQLAPDKPEVQQAQSWLKAEMAKSPAAPVEGVESGRDFNARLNQAVVLAQAGNKTQAYQDLKTLSKETGAKDSNLLLWLAFTSPDLEEADTAISMAESQDASNPNVAAARLWLRKEKLKSAYSSAAAAAELKAQANSFNFQSYPRQDFTGYTQQPHNFEAAPNLPPPFGLNSVPSNRFAPEPAFAVASPTISSRRSRVNIVTVLAVALGVMVVLLIGLGIFYLNSGPTTEKRSVFEITSLVTYAEMQELEITQSLKDQMSALSTNPDFAKLNLKLTKMNLYKIKTSSSVRDYSNFYRSELSKAGWKLQSVTTQIIASQSIIEAVKDNYYILMVSAFSSDLVPELKAQLAPNQAIAVVLLFEKIQQK